MPKEKIIYDQAMMNLAVEAEQAGIKGMSYEEFRKKRISFEQDSVEKLETLRQELESLKAVNLHPTP
jgi:hypothetical protein